MKNNIILIIVILFNIFGFSQTKEDDIKTLITISGAEKQITTYTQSLFPYLQEQINQQELPVDKKDELEDYISFLMDEITQISTQLLNEDMPKIYSDNFTHQEIKDLIAFYNTATGQKILELQPQITEQTMQLMNTKYMPEFTQKMKAKLDQIMGEATEHSH